MSEFKVLDQFIQQKEEMTRMGQEMAKREQAAVEEYQALKAEYETMIKRSVVEGKDMTKQLDAQAEKIEKAKTAAERRKQEHQIFSATRPNETIKAEDVVTAWNSEFVPAFHTEKMQPVLDALINAKKTLTEAVLAYHDVTNEFEAKRYECRSELADTHYYELKDVALQTRQEHEKYFVMIEDLQELAANQRPSSLGGVK
jgi:hypothetical protein